MKKNCLMHYIEMMFEIHTIPMRIFDDGRLVKRYEFLPFPVPDIDRGMIGHLSTDTVNAAVYETGNLFLYGAVKDKRKNLFVTVGPVRSILPEDSTVRQIAEFLGYPVAEMRVYLDGLPLMTSGKFSQIISGMHTAINNEIVTADELYKSIAEWKPNFGIVKTALDHEEDRTFAEQPDRNPYETEQQLLYYVRSGMVNELRECWLHIDPENLFTVTNDRTLRNAKNHCILGLGLIADAAIKGGIPPESAQELRELYMKKTEQCTTLQQVMQLRCTIFCDYSERTSRLHFHKPDSSLIDGAVSYILQNIAGEITLGKVAEFLKTGKTYLSTRFKEEMGVGFTEFVNMEKVEKSKELLLFTDKSIAEIAAYLSFSSQGYFQSVFKKYAGTTPNAFRKSEAGKFPPTR